MFKHNLLLIYRTFKRYKSSFFINLISLSSGLASALLIYLWVNNERSMDKFHEKDEQLYQVMKNVTTASGILTQEYTPGRLADALKKEIPEIEYAVAVVPSTRFSNKGIVSTDNDIRVRATGQCVGTDYFNTFSIHFVQGIKESMLSDPYNIAISETLAKKLFGTTDNVLGKMVKWDHDILKGTYMIAGIFKEHELSSAPPFDILFSYDLFIEQNPKLENWSNSDPNTYVVVRHETNIEELNGKIANFMKDKSPNSTETLFLQQYSKKYLYNYYENGQQAGGRILYIRLFSIVAIFLLFIACINFMNLSTAKSLQRVKEVGIKKAIGAGRNLLIVQYLGESILMALISAMVAVLLVALLLPRFNIITGKHLILDFNFTFLLRFLSIILATGIVAGSYPALYLSKFNPITVLKGKLNSSAGEFWARKSLVIFQFVLSVIMIASVLVVVKQIELVQTKNLGYNRDNILYFEKPINENQQKGEAYEKELENFLKAVKQTNGVVNASNFRHSIIDRQGGTSDLSWPGKAPETKMDFTDLPVGYDFIETMGVEIKEGRSFSRDFNAEKSSIIFNETAIQSMGLVDPIGKVVRIWGEDREIIGVAKDFHFRSFYENIKPMFFDFSLNPRVSKIIVKIDSKSSKETIDRLQKVYNQHYPGVHFEYSFLDNDYQLLYESENRVARLSQYFAGMAILISCLGLFGLASFTAERKTKEIGIRKIMGASEWGIISLLSAYFAKPVFISVIIALPVSYFIIRNWLNNFAYHIDLTLWYFVGAGVFALLIALATVITQTIKVARINPVDTLRAE